MLEAVPPVAFVPYQFNVAPVEAVAVKAIGVALRQYTKAVADTVGAAGKATTLTVIVALGPSHLPRVWLT